MKKTVKTGSVVVYKDPQDGEIAASIITHITGNEKRKYYRAGQNGLGMVMDYIDEQLIIPGLNKRLKASFDSIEEILSCKKKKIRSEALYMLVYYAQLADDTQRRLYEALSERGMTREDITERFHQSEEEEKMHFLGAGIMNLVSPEEATEFLKGIDDEKTLYAFVKTKSDRAYFFNKNRALIEEKISSVIKDENMKKRSMIKLLSLAWELIEEKPEYMKYVADIFSDLPTRDKKMFMYRLNTSLVNIARSERPYKEIILKNIVGALTGSEAFVEFVSANIGDYFETLSGDRDYDLGHYFDIMAFVDLSNFKTTLLGEVSIDEILKSDAITGDIIAYIFDRGLYRSAYEDGSDATENNLSNIAGHKNTPSRILEEIVRQDRTYLSLDSYGKWDVVSALQNPNIDEGFLRNTLEKTGDPAVIYGCLSNPKCPKEQYERLKWAYGDSFTYSTSGCNLVHTFS